MSWVTAKIKEWVADRKWYIAVYLVFIALFWFLAASEMTAAEAYFGLLALHVVYLGGVWVVDNIIR